MKTFLVLALSLTLTACAPAREFAARHPTATKFAIGSLALTAGIALSGSNSDRERVGLPAEPCSTAEACR